MDVFSFDQKKEVFILFIRYNIIFANIIQPTFNAELWSIEAKSKGQQTGGYQLNEIKNHVNMFNLTSLSKGSNTTQDKKI